MVLFLYEYLIHYYPSCSLKIDISFCKSYMNIKIKNYFHLIILPAEWWSWYVKIDPMWHIDWKRTALFIKNNKTFWECWNGAILSKIKIIYFQNISNSYKFNQSSVDKLQYFITNRFASAKIWSISIKICYIYHIYDRI